MLIFHKLPLHFLLLDSYLPLNHDVYYIIAFDGFLFDDVACLSLRD